MKLASYFWPQKIAEFTSAFNGKVSVVESFGRYYIDVGGLMQSGPFLVKTWTKALQKLHLPQKKVDRVLILGLGGGSFVHVIKRFFPEADITAVDIDSVIVDVGKKYLQLASSTDVHIYIEDAQTFVEALAKRKAQYDLIFVDMYSGFTIPAFVESTTFLRQLKKCVTNNGSVIFNRLYFQTHKNEASKFLDKLAQIFDSISTAKVYANIVVLAH